MAPRNFPSLASVLFAFLAIPVGGLAIIAGEADDSPGLQGLGLILLLAVFYRSVRQYKAVRTRLKKRDG